MELECRGDIIRVEKEDEKDVFTFDEIARNGILEASRTNTQAL